MSTIEMTGGVTLGALNSPLVAKTSSTLADQLAALQTLNAKLIYLHRDQVVYEEMVKSAQRIIGCDFCALFTFEEEDGVLEPRAWSGFADDLAKAAISLAEGKSTLHQAFLEEYLIYVPDVAAAPEGIRLHPEMSSELVIPIISKRGPVGLIDFGSRTKAAFSDQDIQLCSMLVDQLAFSLENIVLLDELTATRDAVIHGMALLAESRDGHIGGHLTRICAYAELLANRLMLDSVHGGQVDDDFVQTISRSAALHDVGKVGIPDDILLKPDRLTAGEYEIMKTHTTIGGDLLEKLMRGHGSFLMLRMGADVAYGHHERWDGQGYPRGQQGEDIPLAARIVAICDFYDALTSKRIYKGALPHDDVINLVREESGAQFDPHLVSVFCERAAEFQEIHCSTQD
jgi:HD-GYP domain-containing protein (c-di-GMP phosphodiesterase class II)